MITQFIFTPFVPFCSKKPRSSLKQSQQYVLTVCNFSHSGSLKRDHIEYRPSRGKGESEKEIKKRFVCQSILTHSISLAPPWKRGREKGRGQLSVNLPMKCWQNSQFSVISPRPSFSSLLTQNPLISNSGTLRPLTRISSLTPLAGQKDVTVVPLRSGGRRLRTRLHKGRLCLASGLSWAPVKG